MLREAVRRWHTDLHAKFAALAAADAEMAALNIREVTAGIYHETPEFRRANHKAIDAAWAVPFGFRRYADHLSHKANRDAWQEVFDLEADADDALEAEEALDD